MNTKRCKHAIVAEILQSVSREGGATKKTIFEEDTKLNYNYGNKLLNKLIEKDLVITDRPGRRGAKYRLSWWGEGWLKFYTSINNELL
jgi:predicted transcriptional regulator